MTAATNTVLIRYGIHQASLTSKILRGVFQLGGYFGFSAEGGYFLENTPSKRREKSEVRLLALLRP